MQNEYRELLIKYKKLEFEISKMSEEEAKLKKQELEDLKEEVNIARKNNLKIELQNTLDKMNERRNLK